MKMEFQLNSVSTMRKKTTQSLIKPKKDSVEEVESFYTQDDQWYCQNNEFETFI